MARTASRLIAPALLLAATVGSAAAQTVHGTLVDPATGAGIRGAAVVLVDGGRESASAVTGPAGEFTLRAGHGGRFTLRADRIGYRATTSAPFDVAVGQTVEQRLAASAARIALEGITVTARSRCQVRPGEEPATAGTAVVWEEARKALRMARATSRDRLYRFEMRRYRRELDPRTEAVKREEARPVSAWAGDPFVSAPPAELAARGWMRAEGDTLVYFAPDAAALLSDEFQDSHCLRLAEAPPEHPGWIGVAFEPVREGPNPDVKGTVWVDRRTAELQAVDYRYTGLPGGRRAEDASQGTIAFLRLPSAGNWIVSRWRVRMPQVAFSRLEPGGSVMADVIHARVQGLLEEGGEVTSVTLADGRPVPLAAGATLVGLVFDSTRSAPLAGATVSLEGTPYSAVTDAAGRFDLRDLPEGTYRATFASARLDSLGFRPAPVAVTIQPGASASVDLAVPSLSRVLAAACADSAGNGGAAPLVGTVRTEGADVPARGAAVTAWWNQPGDTATVRRVALADYRGVYRFCSLPAGTLLRLGAAGAGGEPVTVQVSLTPGVAAQQDLTVPRPARAAPASPSPGVTGPALNVAAVWGRVLSPTGTPVAGATVRLGADVPPVTTDRGGRFRIDRVRSGTYDVTVTAPLFGERHARAEVPRGGLDLELRLPARSAGTVALAAVVVTARNLTPTEVARRRAGARVDLLTRDDLDRAVGMPDVQNVLRAKIPTIDIREVYYTGTAMVKSTLMFYHETQIAVYLDDQRMDPADFAHVPPSQIESMEFYPTGYLSYGDLPLQPVLMMHSRK